MAMAAPFIMDGVVYNVHVESLTRKFSVNDTDKSGRTLDGSMYRDIVGTFYNYELQVSRKGNDTEALDALWEAISQPVNSHVCTFPYNQTTLTQRMYVTSGEQSLKLLDPQKTYWNGLKISYIAMTPKVVP